ncbi:MAG: hypothetical protein H0V90_09475 [Blastocatellia bacterium]|nr:hypothetical protein [Blastocatellia bacterium]
MNKNKAETRWNGIGFDAQIIRSNSSFDYSTPEPEPIQFYYDCDFCRLELPNDSVRFDGCGSCPRCFQLAHRFVESLRRYRQTYAARLSGRAK